MHSCTNMNELVFLTTGLRNIGPNGKINNMIRAYEAAKYDNIVISDTGIKSKYQPGLDFLYSFICHFYVETCVSHLIVQCSE